MNKLSKQSDTIYGVFEYLNMLVLKLTIYGILLEYFGAM